MPIEVLAIDVGVLGKSAGMALGEHVRGQRQSVYWHYAMLAALSKSTHLIRNGWAIAPNSIGN
jgi:hypothetical protein